MIVARPNPSSWAPWPLVLVAAAMGGCGGSVAFEEAGEGGGAATAGGAPPSCDAEKTSGGGPRAACSQHRVYTECLKDDACVPVFDNACCPDCPRTTYCDYCREFRFIECTGRLPERSHGTCAEPSCGVTPAWSCGGTIADCERGAGPGCVCVSACEANGCGCDRMGVGADACDAPTCDEPPPFCLGGWVPEVSCGCWTGRCMPDWICKPVPPR